MINPDEEPSKRLKTDLLDVEDDIPPDYVFNSLGMDCTVEEEIVGTEVKLELEGCLMISVDDPTTLEESLLFVKRRLINKKGLGLKFSVPTPLHKEEAVKYLKRIIAAARLTHLDLVEAYFAEDDDDLGPFSLRNELHALSSVLSSINNSACTSESAKNALVVLRQAIIRGIKSLERYQSEKMNRMSDACVDAAAKKLLNEGKRAGMVTKLDVAYFQEAERGLVASEDIKIGDVVLEVPVDLMGCAFFPECLKLDHSDKWRLSTDDMNVLWVMKEKCNKNGKFKTLFGSLPNKELKTGLWFGEKASTAVGGTPLKDTIQAREEVLERRFNSAIKPVLEENRHLFPSCGFDEFKFAWALWNCYSVNISGGPWGLETLMVPVACFFNHSQLPHILCGSYDPRDHVVRFIASRPCKKGDQCYLSYGNFSGDHFVTFYGFLPKGVNYHDVIEFDFDVDLGVECVWPPRNEKEWPNQLARRKWPISGRSGLTGGLRAHMKDVAKRFSCRPSNEDAYRLLQNTIAGLSDRLVDECEDDCLDASERDPWDVKLAYSYKEQHRDFLACVYFEVCDIIRDEA